MKLSIALHSLRACEAQDNNRAIKEEVADAEHRCEEYGGGKLSRNSFTAVKKLLPSANECMLLSVVHAQDARASVRAERTSRAHAETQATGGAHAK